MGESAGGDDWLRGRRVAVTGRFASLAHDEVRKIIEFHGGRFQRTPSRQTRYLVVGDEGLPLEEDSRPSRALRKAHRLALWGYPLEILPESEFWKRLGIAGGDAIQRYQTVAQIARMMDVDRDTIRRWVRTGLIEPVAIVHQSPLFDFSQVKCALMLCEIVKGGVPLPKLRRNLEQLQRLLPRAQFSLAQLASIERSGQVCFRDADDRLLDAAGQLRLDFDGAPSDEYADSSCLPIEKQRTADNWFDIGVACEEDGRWHEARKAYEAAAQLDPDCADLQFNLGNVYAELGLHDLAAGAYDAALALVPDYAEAWNNLGITLGILGEDEAAIAALRHAVEYVPTYTDALENLAAALQEIGRGEEALYFRRRFLAAERNNHRTANIGRMSVAPEPVVRQ